MTVLTFPTAWRLYYPHERRLLKRIRMMVRFWIRRPFIKVPTLRLLDWINQHPVWAPIIQNNEQRLHAVFYRFGDKTWPIEKRVDAIISSFDWMQRRLGKVRTSLLVQEGRLPLAKVTETLTLYLCINTIDAQEGFFSLSLRDENDHRCYDTSFVVLPDGRLLIASIQGPKGEDAADRVKQVTKAMHGERPMFAMVEGLRALAQVWKTSLLGVVHAHQVKLRNHGRMKVYFDYDTFWGECEGKRTEEGWTLSLTKTRKNLEDVPSKKRAQYRRRFEMMDQLLVQTQAALC